MNVGVKKFLLGNILILFSKDIDHFLLVGFYLCELTVGNEERIGIGCLFHCWCYILINSGE